jgi:uncharacterized membrane protein
MAQLFFQVGGTVAGGAVGATVGAGALSILGPIGASAGALAGGAVGAPIGMVKGCIVGALGHMTVEGMDKDKLKDLGISLEPGSSAMVLVFSEVIVTKSKFEKEIEAYKQGTDKIAHAMSTQISEELKKGNHIAFLLAVAEEGIVGMRVISGDEVLHINQVIVTEDMVAAKEFLATPEGVAARGVVATPEGMAAAQMVATKDAVISEGMVVTKDMVEYEVEAAVAE